jgi:hypothetical protein
VLNDVQLSRQNNLQIKRVGWQSSAHVGRGEKKEKNGTMDKLHPTDANHYAAKDTLLNGKPHLRA